MPCKICGSLNTAKIFDAGNTHGRYTLDRDSVFEVYRCRDCQAVFVDGIILNNEYFSKYYQRNYYSNEGEAGIANQMIRLFGRMVIGLKESEIVKHLSCPNNTKLRILDIGCGSGEFLASISSNRFEKYGLEINPEGVARCREKSIEVFNRDIKDAGFNPGLFDVITMWHVLEHLDKPVDLLLEARRILKSNGVLAISTPNTDSIGFRYGRNNWFHLDSPRHLILYNLRSLGYLLRKTGFKIIRKRNAFYDFPLDLFWSVRKSWAKYFIYPLYPISKFFSRETVLFICRQDSF